jgi:hypothetical protein
MFEKKNCRSILLFNGLSALILSAVGVELLIYIIIQDTTIQNEESDRTNDNGDMLEQDSIKWIIRWRGVFNKFCKNLLEDHLIDLENNYITYSYERKATVKQSNPFQNHAVLLIEATKLLIQNHNDQELVLMPRKKSNHGFISFPV